MFRKSMFLLCSCAIAATLAACGSDAGTKAKSSTPPTGRPSLATPTQATTILFTTGTLDRVPVSEQGDLWSYDVARDRVTRLTSDGKHVWETAPTFHGSKITFAADRKIVDFDPATSRRETITTWAGTLLAFAWSRDGTKLAYIDVDYERDSIHHLKVLDTATGRTTELKKLGTPPGRGGTSSDVVSLAWNHAGTEILVTDSHLDDGICVRILRVKDGTDVITPLHSATNGLWSIDEHSIYVHLLEGPGNDSSWIRLDLADGSKHTLALDQSAYGAKLSPDGGRLAATAALDGRSGFSVAILDLATNKQTALSSTNYAEPIWLTNTTLAVMKPGDCPPMTEGCNYSNKGIVSLSLSGTVTELSLTTTFGVDATAILYA